MNSVENSPLGKVSEYVSTYSPELLFPIPRATKWSEWGLEAGQLPYQGVDIWTCFELSWLDALGKPHVAIAEISVPADSPSLIESKSLKLYLNSFNQTVVTNSADLEACLVKDLSAVAQAPVAVKIYTLSQMQQKGVQNLPGECVDDLPVQVTQYEHPDAALLQVGAATEATQVLHSHLLKSNCPVTGQPDWGSVVVELEGAALSPESLLRYLVSFRQHADFHEQCVERIFLDIYQRIAPKELTVYARYVRRGGLDINPYRSTRAGTPELPRTVRQ